MPAQLYEERVIDQVRRELANEAISGLQVRDLRLEGSYPGTRLILTFEHADRPGCTFGYKWPVWSADPEEHADPYFPAMGFIINLREELEAPDLGLPAECSPDTVTWIGPLPPEPPGSDATLRERQACLRVWAH